jgi:type I restriction-modification system DNA methylase subunit
MADAAFADHRAQLREIKSFPALVGYLRDEMGWPIDGDDLEPITFEYTAEELGIDSASAAKILEIKRLRPLAIGQPWGIFFVRFDPKRLPVVALRRILSRVVRKKRASANSAERTAWEAQDLLFLSNFGEGEDRQICFAHFALDDRKTDLPILKVLGWDDRDTPLHLDGVADKLGLLAWPDDEHDLEGWRKKWRSAFSLRHREVITTSKILAERLAELARAIRDRINTILSVETEDGPLTKLMKAFREALVHDLDADGFADMYAQTIAYGLLSARIADPKADTADDFAAHIRTSPFLRELMEAFLHAGGRKGKAGGPGGDFDELGVSDVVALLDDPNTNMEAILRDFGDRKPEEDPVIHFYELFLKEYDARKRTQRGVFYTPLPVVSYIVRSVHELLQTEFGLPDGLADTATWGDMAKRHPGLTLPEGAKPADRFVTVLDPATGTGTFLVEAIEVIHRTLVDRWAREGHSAQKIVDLWNDYVPEHLLPRLYGYELMMAPYAIAHVKIGLKLHETGYRFESEERARIYLTNSLEPPEDLSGKFAFAIPALAHEAKAVNVIKKNQRFTVVIGNPPYSALSANLTLRARNLVTRFKFIGGTRIDERGALQLEKNLQDDYIKFLAFAEDCLSAAYTGIGGFICNHGFIDNPTLRGVRWSILQTFNRVWVLDLHGNVNRGETAPDGSDDQNVFDIKDAGVAICLCAKSPQAKGMEARIQKNDLWGSRDRIKYPFLFSNSVLSQLWQSVVSQPDLFLFRVLSGDGASEYSLWPKMTTIFPLHSIGIITARDAYVIDFEPSAVVQRARAFRDSTLDDEGTCKALGIPVKKGWNIKRARERINQVDNLSDRVKPLLYRPFDKRAIFYHESLVWGMAWPVMQHMLSGENCALITSRMTKGETFCHALVGNTLSEVILLSSRTSNNAFVFPLRYI